MADSVDPRASLPDANDPAWELLERYRPELIAQARLILDNLADAEDVVQETFIEALRHRDQINQTRSLGAWLSAINRCNAVDRVRGKRSDSQRLLRQQNLAPEQTFTTGGFSVFELRDSVEKALEQLPEELRQVVRLRHFEHLSYKDIAARLNIPIGNVSGMLMDASMRLYAKLKKQLETGGNIAPQSAPPRPANPSTPTTPPGSSTPEDDNLPTQFVRGAV